MDQGQGLTSEQPDGIGMIKSVVCIYCRNRLRQGCITECATEGLYRNLEPIELDWRYPPKLPSMARLLELAPVTRLALVTLMLHYLTHDLSGNSQIFSDRD